MEGFLLAEIVQKMRFKSLSSCTCKFDSVSWHEKNNFQLYKIHRKNAFIQGNVCRGFDNSPNFHWMLIILANASLEL